MEGQLLSTLAMTGAAICGASDGFSFASYCQVGGRGEAAVAGLGPVLEG
jgi:hypothetical protein